MQLSNISEITGSAEPIIACRQALDEAKHLSLVGFHTSGISAAMHRRAAPGLGLTQPTPVAASYLNIVQLQAIGPTDVYRGGRHYARPDLDDNGLMILDMSESWMADLRRPFHSVDFILSKQAIAQLCDELDARGSGELAWTPSDPHQDEVLGSLARLIVPALKRPQEANALFVSHIFSAVRLHIMQRYGGMQPVTKPLRGTLAPWQERRARELLESDLSHDVTIEALSAECRLSPTHFTRAFTASMGKSPHRWRVHCRIERVKTAIRGTDESLSSIAVAFGFADQSHLTRVFRKAVGVSPGAWRRAVRQG